MGNKLVTFTDQQLDNYQDCTFFTRKEILRLVEEVRKTSFMFDILPLTTRTSFLISLVHVVDFEKSFHLYIWENLPTAENIGSVVCERVIYGVYKKFRLVRPDMVPKRMKQNQTVTVRIPMDDTVKKLPELLENPFKRRICEVFSRDGKGNLSFEDFLDLHSVFSEHAPRDIKVFYAFRIYDFDGDQHIGGEDIDDALKLLTGQELSPDERQQIVDKVMEEADVDGDGKLSYMEFEHVITRAPEFLSTFHIRI